MLWHEESPYHHLGLPADVDNEQITSAFRRSHASGAERRQLRTARDTLGTRETSHRRRPTLSGSGGR